MNLRRKKMKFTGLELFMEKLQQMISGGYNPLINNHPSFLSQRPQFQQLYEELDSIIQTLCLIDEHHQQVTDLKKRFKDAAEEAHDIIDRFVVNLGITISRNQASVNQPHATGNCMPVRFTKSVKKEKLSLEDVMRSIKSIKEEIIAINNKLKMDSSPSSDSMRTPSTGDPGTSNPKSPLGSKKAPEDIVVGFDRHAELIRDKLVEDQKQLHVVSIVGMGGLGKTTLATKVFNDHFIMHHFHVRGWVTVSQTYEKEDLLIRILESIGHKIDNLRHPGYAQLRQIVRQKLMGKRYLMVIDDIWSPEAWDALKLFFPNGHVGSRILLTSRLKEVALHANSHGFIHQLECLTEKESWELLRQKVFRDNNVCPEWLVEPGMKIARSCHGLPLTLVVMAGVLMKETLSKYSWERTGQNVSSYIVSNETECVETLAWSFNHLPGHLRDCYLYLGGFPEGYKFQVQSLIWLWMAEGFIQEDGHQSLEEIGEDHVVELVDRNLVVVADRKSNGDIKAFYVQNLLRELCVKIATKEGLYLKAQRTTRSDETHKQRRIFIEDNINIRFAPRIRSLLCFYRLDDRREVINKWSRIWRLLIVLDLKCLPLNYFPEEISLLFHLRYLAISNAEREFPSSICKLWNLQTLIIRMEDFRLLKLPEAISNLVNLRHLKCEKYSNILFPAIQKPMNLQTISRMQLVDGANSWVNCFPDIKKLSCDIQRQNECDLESLTSLEHVKLSGPWFMGREMKFIGFPPLLKSLTLEGCDLCWSDMPIIQALPNLEVLKLRYGSFVGPRWDAGEEGFRRLKVLKLYVLDLKEWKASSINFPCLKRLVVKWCYELEGIPLDFGNISTLELISVYHCQDSLVESLDTIKEEQNVLGNFELMISVYNGS